MSKFIKYFILLLVLAGPSGTHAQGSLATIDQLEIALWPEYDRKAVLVIYWFWLAPDSSLPANVSLPIPANVGEPHAVAWHDEAGRQFDADYTLQGSGDWVNVLIRMEGRKGQLEFYSDLEIAGSNRSFSVLWPGDVAVGNLTYEIQQPVGASDLIISPSPQEQSIGQDGLLYLRGSLAGTGQISIQAQYQKETDALSAEVPIPALVQPEAPTERTVASAPILPWIVGGVGLAMLAVGGFFYLRLSRRQTQAPARSRRSRTKSEGSQVEIDASPVYCHDCGKRADHSDIYCRQCGTRLRHR
jgi:hypothetical protein